MADVLREFDKKQQKNILKEELSKQQISQIRSNIERIISSYRHIWDIYTELLQNSADAIIEKFGEDKIEQGRIELEINTEQREIIITDNGIGIEESEISKILVNGKSLKREKNTGKFGFMGYGFTFVAFQSNLLKIESIKDGIKASRTYRDLYHFIYSKSELPNSEEEEIDQKSQSTSEESQTKITVKFPNDFPNEVVEETLSTAFNFAKCEKTIEAILRTRSVVGTLDKVFSSKEYFQFSLKVDGQKFKIKTGYLTVREIVREVVGIEQSFYNRLDEYETLIKLGDDKFSQTQKEAAFKANLLDEKIDEIEFGSKNPLSARILISATSKNFINKFNERFHNNDISTDFKIEHGCWLAINGMPTGICIHPFDDSNYFPYTVLVDIKDNSIRTELDSGRKGISPYRMKQISDKVFEILKDRNYIKYRRYIVEGDTRTRISDPFYIPYEKLNDKLKEKRYFESSLTQKYLPPLEEQEVLGLFIEIVAKNLLKGYELKILSGYQVYDGLYYYNLTESQDIYYSNDNQLGIHKTIFTNYGSSLRKDILIEFKRNLQDIYSDINNNKKDANHIDILVCWDVEFENKNKLQKEKGDILMERDIMRNVFYGVTHSLTVTGRQQALPIIELKKVLEILFNYTDKNL
ncbi:ATP-binding protein [Microcystis aeruginosa]|uniref:Histidine kinase/HSP90-like ATPase domain-containing protein n=1 Tax=Microcystis aeruginosa Ma_QC_C_20070703_M131 TaxID=2486263 RepID=A0A551YBU0_MICAE|nr:ATP-binding protein [Microcystis aeruginosa]MDB9391880.1 ATP-binding protein [Microcystis aeruginosa CS-579]TRT58434.1 MAG: hypothetical protein EWV85_06025 [Microcystis aeruginosa Ma_QC_C_20070703_M131]